MNPIWKHLSESPDLSTEEAITASFLLLAAAFPVFAILQLLRRMLAGASPGDLLGDAFYECPPVRGGLWFLRWMALLSAIAAAAIAIRAGWLAYEGWDEAPDARLPLLAWSAGALVAGALLLWIGGILHRWLAEGGQEIPRVATRIVATKEGIPDAEIAKAGIEAFPNQVAKLWRLGLWCRRLALWLLLALIGGLSVYFVGTHADPEYSGELAFFAIAQEWCLAQWSAAAPYLASIGARGYAWHPVLALVAAYFALVCHLVFLFANRRYLLLSSPAHYLALAATGSAVLLALAPHLSENGLAIAATAAASFLCCRLGADLGAARRSQKRARVCGPLKERLEAECRFLPELVRRRSDCLPELDAREIERRISCGAENLSEASPFVKRHFGRYLRLAEIRRRPCAIAMLRYLTVGRRVCTVASWATTKSLRDPRVPVWDLDLFPLHPPAGYRNSDHRLELSAEWNAVCYCSRCGGSGTVTETETRTEYRSVSRTVYHSNGQSSYVTETVPVSVTYEVKRTCPSCSGSGRIEHARAIDTLWRVERAAVSSPEFRLIDITDGAEEVEHASVPYVEAMEPVAANGPAPEDGDPLDEAMRSAGHRLAAASRGSVDEILSLTGGSRLYRSEFSVHGFHILKIRFRSLGAKTGWFFGARPEFHFPRLPFSYGMLVAALLLPPTALLATLAWIVAVVEVWKLVGAFG